MMERKQALRRNMLVILVLAVLIAAVVLMSALLPDRVVPSGGALLPDAATAVPADAAGQPIRAYLVVSVAGTTYEPIPLRAEGQFTITRGERVNVIEVTEDSVRMAASTCDNQDCVMQGVVSLANMAERALQNMVICLPNEVTLHLYTPELLELALVEIPEETNAP